LDLAAADVSPTKLVSIAESLTWRNLDIWWFESLGVCAWGVQIHMSPGHKVPATYLTSVNVPLDLTVVGPIHTYCVYNIFAI
jgi:hypothetical protein